MSTLPSEWLAPSDWSRADRRALREEILDVCGIAETSQMVAAGIRIVTTDRLLIDVRRTPDGWYTIAGRTEYDRDPWDLPTEQYRTATSGPWARDEVRSAVSRLVWSLRTPEENR